ncbi:MAG: hypothetical protein ACXABO_13035 [Promethearchaeota archaeon]
MSENSKKFVEKNGILNIIVDIDFIEEKCAQIYDPVVKVIKDRDLRKFKDYTKVSNEVITLYISNSFINAYGILNEFQLDIGGLVKKRLFFSNIEPMIREICKI